VRVFELVAVLSAGKHRTEGSCIMPYQPSDFTLPAELLDQIAEQG